MALTPGGGGNPVSGILGQARDMAMAAYGGLASAPEDPNAPSPEAARWLGFLEPLARPEDVPRRPSFILPGQPVPPSISRPRRKPTYGGKTTKELNRAKGVDRERLAQLVEGILGETPSPEDLVEAWTWAVQQVDVAAKMGLDPHDPWHWLQQRAAGAAEDRPGPKSVTSTQRSVNLTDPETARAIARSAAATALGRKLDDDEFAEFLSSLNAGERANPTVTTTTSDYDEQGQLVNSSSTTTGGAPSPDAAADNFLDEEFGTEQDVFRAATQYFDVAQALAGGIV